MFKQTRYILREKEDALDLLFPERKTLPGIPDELLYKGCCTPCFRPSETGKHLMMPHGSHKAKIP